MGKTYESGLLTETETGGTPTEEETTERDKQEDTKVGLHLDQGRGQGQDPRGQDREITREVEAEVAADQNQNPRERGHHQNLLVGEKNRRNRTEVGMIHDLHLERKRKNG